MAKKVSGCLVVLAVFGAIAVAGFIGVVYFLKKTTDVVQDFATGVGVSPEVANKVKSLNRDYEFERPQDNHITEEQVTRFIAIKQEFVERVKRHQDRFEELEQRAEDSAGWKEVAETYKILGDIRRDFLKSLRENEMSPREYAFLTEQIYQAYFTSAATTGVEQMQAGLAQAQQTYGEQLARMKEQLQQEDLSDEQRQAITSGMETYKSALEQAKTSATEMEQEIEALPKENIALLDKYRTELEEVNTLGFEFWGMALTDYE